MNNGIRNRARKPVTSAFECHGSDMESVSQAVGAVLSNVDHNLLNGRQLVERLNVKYDFFKDMRLAGFQPPISGLCTLTYAMDWINKNPSFREDARILKLSRKPRLALNPSCLTAGKSYAPPLKHGGRHS
jgi:hypothetical protein